MLELLGVPAGEAVMVGDSIEDDVEGALARRRRAKTSSVRRGDCHFRDGGPLRASCHVNVVATSWEQAHIARRLGR